MKIFKSFGYLLLGLVSVVYLLNPGAGVFELLPDNIPVLGNLDEAGAVLLLFKCLGHFGIGFMRPKRTDDVIDADETER